MKMLQSIIIMLLGLSWPLAAQDGSYDLPVTSSLAISDVHTTSLLFPYPIISVDRGSQHILAQKPKGVENILQIKAAQQDFTASNLTVVTSDGKLYNFLIAYEPEPFSYAYDFSAAKAKGSAITNYYNSEQINALASMAYHDRSRISISEEAYDITLSVTGIFIAEDYIFYRITLENETTISYDIDQLRFFVRDQKRSRRTASQEVELTPISIYQPVLKVPAKSLKSFVVVLPKFTIPNKKNLYLQLTELSGGRHLLMKIKNTKAGRVVPLPTIKQ
jgi:conjugative transposon TraN protein